MTLPLDGVRVLDFCHIWAGPLCGRLLGDLGAEVVKIEGLKRIDGLRPQVLVPVDPTEEYYNQGAWYTFCNAGKQDATIDASTPEGLAVLRRLVLEGGWDVVLENFTPRVLKHWGLDYESITDALPSLIMVSLSGYGHHGPWRDYKANGNGLEPACGVSSQTGYRGGPPSRSAFALPDPLAGLLAAACVLAALRARRRDGRGQHVVLSQYEVPIPLVAGPLLDWELNRREWERIGNRSRRFAPQGCFRCAGDDNWLALTCRDDDEWRNLCRGIDRPELAGEARFATLEGRQHGHDEIDRIVEEWTRERDHIEAFHRLQAAGVPAMAVLNGKESLLDPQHRARGFWYRGEINGSGPFPLARQVAGRFEHTSVRMPRRAPRLGEHNAEVLGRIGVDGGEIEQLEQRGIAGTRPVFGLPLDEMRKALRLPIEELMELGQILRIEPDYRSELRLDELP